MAVLVESQNSAGIEHPKRKRWTRAELQQLIDEGHQEFERYELFDGELIDKMGKNWPHVTVLHRIAAGLRRGFGEERVAQEAPINLRPEDEATYRPEPDVIVLNKGYSSFIASEPYPQDILLAVEVGDSSIRFDLAAKSRAYALAGIAEYWVADIGGQRIVVHRYPEEGRYLKIEALAAGQSVSPVCLPSLTIAVDAIFDGVEP